MEIPPRVLVAVSPAELQALEGVLAGHATLVPVFAREQALKALDRTIRLVVCSTQFDDSRMFYLLHDLKAAAPSVPVVCCCVLDPHFTRETLEGMGMAARHLGAAAFVDLHALRREHGHREGDARFVKLVLEHLGP